MYNCETCKWGNGCLLSMPEIKAGECEKLYQLADKKTLLERLNDKYHWTNKIYIKQALKSKE